MKQCRKHIKGVWAPTIDRIKSIGFEKAIATSGTLQNLALMALAKNNPVMPEILNGLSVNTKDILDVIQSIIDAKTNEKRKSLPGMDPGRADIILAGALIIEYAIKTLGIKTITISSYALREGIIFDTIDQSKLLSKSGQLCNLRQQSLLSICKHFNVDLVHANFVKDISLSIFDELQGLHKLGYQERELLEAAALLHDVGYHISLDKHHKHSYYIIKNCIMPGFSMMEADLIANIARYHRKSTPKNRHLNFVYFSDKDKSTIRCLAAILRIAEGIDRRSKQYIANLLITFENNTVHIKLVPIENAIDTDIELWGADRRKDLLEESINKKIRLSLA